MHKISLLYGDGVLLLVAFGAELLIERRARELLPVILLALVPVACWELFSLSLWQFHALLPNSYLAKHAASSGNGVKIDPSTFLFGVWARSDSIWLYLVVLLAVGMRFFAPAVRLITLWLVLYYVFYSFLAGVPQFMWYTAPFWWSLPVLFGIGAAGVLHNFDRTKPLLTTMRLLFLPMPDGSCSLELTCAIWHSTWFRQHYAVVWQYLRDPDKPYAILAAR